MKCNACQTWVIPDDKYASFMSNVYFILDTLKDLWKEPAVWIVSAWLARNALLEQKHQGRRWDTRLFINDVMWDSLKITKYLNCAEDCGLSAALDGFYKRSENWIFISCRWCLLCHVLCDCCCCHLKKNLASVMFYVVFVFIVWECETWPMS